MTSSRILMMYSEEGGAGFLGEARRDSTAKGWWLSALMRLNFSKNSWNVQEGSSRGFCQMP